MNNQYIAKSMFGYRYIAHTNSCYHLASVDGCFNITDKSKRDRAVKDKIKKLVEAGELSLLPHRITILTGMAMAKVRNEGRAKTPMVAQLKGSFTAIEDSPYKCYKPYNVQTGLWKVDGYQSYFVGSLGTSGTNGRIERDNSDLLIVHTTDWRELDLYVFRGLAGTQKQLDYLPDVMAHLKQIV